MRSLLVMLVCVGGCLPFPDTEPMPCWMHNELEKVGLAYEIMHDTALTNEQWSCLHDIEVAWPSDEYYQELCEGGQACYLEMDKQYALVFKTEVLTWPYERNFYALVRHEGLHRLLDCLGRKDYGDHTNVEFACSPGNTTATIWGGPGSIVRESEYLVSNYCE